MGRLAGSAGRMLALCALASAVVQLPASAQVMPPFYVFTEEDDGDDKACQIRGASLVAATQSALRYNGIAVASRTQFDFDEAIGAYVAATTIQQESGYCFVSLGLRFVRFAHIPDGMFGKTMHVTVEYCNKGSVFGGYSAGLQTRLNDVARDSTNECISEILSELR